VLVAAVLASAFSLASPQPDVTPLQKVFIMKEVRPDVERLGIIWDKEAHDEEVLQKIQRAGTSLNVQLFLAEVSELSDIAPQFRILTQTHNIQALLIVKNDGLVDSSVGKSFLIKSTVKAGIPLIAPSEDWVTEGALLMVKKQDGGIHLVVNKAVADALSLTIPEKYIERTDFLAAN
jgi:putative ABC transport system substrate-binding protein